MAKKKKDEDEFTVEIPPSLSGVLACTWQDTAGEAEFPQLCELLREKRDAKGRITWQGASLTVKVRNGVLRATLVVPTIERQFSFASNSLVNLFADMEEYIKSGPAWEDTYSAKEKAEKAIDKFLKS